MFNAVVADISTGSLVTGLTSGGESMVQAWIDIATGVLPVALPIIGAVAGIYFAISLIKNSL